MALDEYLLKLEQALPSVRIEEHLLGKVPSKEREQLKQDIADFSRELEAAQKQEGKTQVPTVEEGLLDRYLAQCTTFTDCDELLSTVLFSQPMEILELEVTNDPFYFPCIPKKHKIDDGDILAVGKLLLQKHPNIDQLPSQRKLLFHCAQQFLQMCTTHTDGFAFLTPSRAKFKDQDDNPGCDVILVSESNRGVRHIFMIEIKDQKETSEKQWNEKITKLANGPVHRAIKDSLKPNWTFNIVLAGRNKY